MGEKNLRWFQCFVDEGTGKVESVPYRLHPEEIRGFRKEGEYATIVFTQTMGTLRVAEAYEHFSQRLWGFYNLSGDGETEETTTTTTTKKKFLVVKKQPTIDELDKKAAYFDEHQPETNR